MTTYPGPLRAGLVRLRAAQVRPGPVCRCGSSRGSNSLLRAAPPPVLVFSVFRSPRSAALRCWDGLRCFLRTGPVARCWPGCGSVRYTVHIRIINRQGADACGYAGALPRTRARERGKERQGRTVDVEYFTRCTIFPGLYRYICMISCKGMKCPAERRFSPLRGFWVLGNGTIYPGLFARVGAANGLVGDAGSGGRFRRGAGCVLGCA